MALSRRRAKQVARLGRRRTRERDGSVLVEGIRTATEALDAGCDLRFALVAPTLRATGEGRTLADRLNASGADVEEVDDREMEGLADTETPQGVVLVCAQPDPPLDRVVRPGGRYLLLDAVQDPGNAGTLVRAATAFGLDGVVALDGTVDPWNPKTVRASAGMVFRVPVVGAPWEVVKPALTGAELSLLVADAAGEPVADRRWSGGWALAVGNEGAGSRAEVREAAASLLRVPMPGPAESLNVGVAGSILLHTLTDQETRGVPSR